MLYERIQRHRQSGMFKMLVLMATVALIGCSANQDSPMDLPPKLSFVVDYDSFPTAPAAKATYEALSDNTYQNTSVVSVKDTVAKSMGPSNAAGTNFTRAAVNVVVWKLITDVGLLVPRLAFIEAFNHTPKKQSDGSWVWTYTVSLHTAKLVGKKEGNDIVWEMYLSKSGQFTDFNWYSGRHDIAATAGAWTLRKSPTEPYAYVGIDWTRNTSSGTATIKYTNIIPADSGDAQVAENGGYIYYGTNTGITYDAFFNIYYKSANNLVEIEWNRTSLVGRIKDPSYSDPNWLYWDATLADTPAPL